MRLPFELLNDSRFELTKALGVPTFTPTLKSPTIVFDGKKSSFPLHDRMLVKRLTFVANKGRIEKVFYPVFPPDRNASTVLGYLQGKTPSPSAGRLD